MVEVDREPGDYEGMALASFMLLSATFRTLIEKEVFSREDARRILGGILNTLAQTDEVSDPSVHAARVYLSSLVEQLGLPQSVSNELSV